MFEWLDDPKECAKMGITPEMLSTLQALRTEMPKVPMTTNPNAIAVGFSTPKAILPTLPKVKAVHVSLAERVRRDNALCEGCTGTCRKDEINRYWIKSCDSCTATRLKPSNIAKSPNITKFWAPMPTSSRQCSSEFESEALRDRD